MLCYEDSFDLCLELLTDRPHARPQMSEVILTFTVPDVVPDHSQDHVPDFKRKEGMSRHVPYVFRNSGECWRGLRREDRTTWRRARHRDGSRGDPVKK